MCYDVISCPTCGEWLDEFTISSHECKKLRDRSLLETPIALIAKNRRTRSQ